MELTAANLRNPMCNTGTVEELQEVINAELENAYNSKKELPKVIIHSVFVNMNDKFYEYWKNLPKEIEENLTNRGFTYELANTVGFPGPEEDTEYYMIIRW